MEEAIAALMLLVLLGISGILREHFARFYRKGAASTLCCTVGAATYSFLGIAWLFYMVRAQLSFVSVLYTFVTVALLTAMGVFYFKEEVNNREMASIAVATVCLAMLVQFL